MARKKGKSRGFGVGFLLGLVLAVAGSVAYFKWGQNWISKMGTQEGGKPLASVPATTPDIPQTIVPRPSHSLKQPPFGISEDVFEAGAHIYSGRCASCHGRPGHDAPAIGRPKHPAAQLWKRRGDVVGISGAQTGLIYEKTAHGELQDGMPAFEGQLSETQLWQVTLLLKNADQPLPDPVKGILAQKR